MLFFHMIVVPTLMVSDCGLKPKVPLPTIVTIIVVGCGVGLGLGLGFGVGVGVALAGVGVGVVLVTAGAGVAFVGVGQRGCLSEEAIMSNIYLIRHTQHVEDFAAEEQPDEPPLAPIGITQAAHLRDRLTATREIQADVLISSPLLRARATAEFIAPALGLPVMLDEDFQEFRIGNRAGIADKDMGDVCGLVSLLSRFTNAEIRERHFSTGFRPVLYVYDFDL